MLIQHLPRWLLFSAFLLAMNAGMINVLGLFSLLHQSVSHMTGNVSLIADALVKFNFDQLLFLTLVVASYVLGSSYSGFILGNSHFELSQRYGAPLCLVSIFIFLCWVFLPYYPRYALLWASAAMGVQNAMVSHYKGAIIRTTHLSGVLTDLGLAIGYLLKGLPVEPRRIVLHLMILVGFLIGGVIASLVYPYLEFQAFLIPAGLSLLLCVVYWVALFRIFPFSKM